MPGVVALAGTLDLHDVGPEVAKDLRAEGAREHPGEIEHRDALERERVRRHRGQSLAVERRGGPNGWNRRDPKAPAAPTDFYTHRRFAVNSRDSGWRSPPRVCQDARVNNESLDRANV